MQQTMQIPRKVEVKGIRVLTSKQLAEEYGATTQKIKQNFANNRNRFIEGKHYISFTGDELRKFKNQVENFDLVDGRTSHLYLWTEKGALLHAKSLNTDKAWQVYDYLVDFYFRAKEEQKETKPVPKETKPVAKPYLQEVVNIPENPEILSAMQKIKDDITCMQVLLEDCKKYTSEEAYREKRRATAEVVHIIVNDMTTWLKLNPKVIQKQN